MPGKWVLGTFDFIAQGYDIEAMRLMIPKRIAAEEVPRRPGAVIQTVPIASAVPLILAGRLWSATAAARRASVDALTKELSKGRAKLYAHASYDDRWIWATAAGHAFEEVPGSGFRAVTFEVNFSCDDPYWTSETLDTSNYTADGLIKTLAAGGDAPSPPTITITVPAGGLTQFIAANNTTGKTFRWDGTLTNLQTFEVDMAAMTIKENGVLKMSGMNNTAVFWDLQTGNNSLVFTSTPANVSLALTKRARWYP